ncbi:NACHT, LRR and PYD domains-containing protein 1 homolog isoform X2 [Clupea harengus]|nr:NACHT, LRR and PYD domains-containing protein 1 homolog isoform X2 [Clupea harengus]
MTPASLTLSQADSPTSGSFTDFIHKFRWTLLGLEKVELGVRCLTESWANWILNLIHTCPTLKKVKSQASFDFNDGLLLEEGISLLRESHRRPGCTVILRGLRCTKPSGKCGEENEPRLDCNQRVEIQMIGPNVTEEERTLHHCPFTCHTCGLHNICHSGDSGL